MATQAREVGLVYDLPHLLQGEQWGPVSCAKVNCGRGSCKPVFTDRGALHGHWNAPALAAATQPNVFAVNMQCDVHCKKGEEEEEGLKVIQSKAVNEV